MSMTGLTTTELALIIGFGAIVLAGIATLLFLRKRRSARLRSKFGGAEYARAIKESGNRRHAEAALEGRTERVESFHVRAIAPEDRVRFADSWRRIQAQFVDSPSGAVAEAAQLLSLVMSTRGYPVSDFEQRGADISVDHPLVMENYRAAHEIALRQVKGQASTEDLRQAMIHYRRLFEELVSEPDSPQMKAAS
jgi:hypothetical protein